MLLRVLRVRACHVDFPARGDEQLRTCSRADSYTNEMYWDDGLFRTRGAGGSTGTRRRTCRTARVSGCLASRLEPARTTKHPTTALPEQPKITLIAA
jgi:hypothetical protein